MKKKISEKTFLSRNFLPSTKSAKILNKVTKVANETKFSGNTPEFSVANNPNLTRARITTSAVSSIVKESVIDMLPISHGNVVRWIVSLTNGVKFVSSEIFANWNEDGSNLRYTEFGVNTITDDDGFFSVVREKDNILLKFTPVKNAWNAKSIRTVLGLFSQPAKIITFDKRTFSWIFPVPTRSSDPIGVDNDRSYDENFFYAKINGRWLRTPLVDFTINLSTDSGEDEYWYDNLPFVDRPRSPVPLTPFDTGLVGAQTFDDDFFYVKGDIWKRTLLLNFITNKMTTFGEEEFSWIFPVPVSSNDPIGVDNDRSYDENFFYAKVDGQWLRTPLVDFTINLSTDSGEDEYWYDNLPFVDRPRSTIPLTSNDPGEIGAQTFDDDFFYVKDIIWKRALLLNFITNKMTVF